MMSRVIQIIAILSLGGIYVMLFTGAANDITFIMRNNPGNFWPSFLDYLLANLGA